MHQHLKQHILLFLSIAVLISLIFLFVPDPGPIRIEVIFSFLKIF